MGECSQESLTELACRDRNAAFFLKLLAFAAIFFTGAAGVGTPVLFTRYSQSLKVHGTLLSLVKCFAAGVILSTGFVHVLPEAFRALESRCLPLHPWHDFPFAGAVAMAGALLTLLVDVLATKHGEAGPYIPVKSSEAEESAKSRDVEMARSAVFPASCCHGGGGGENPEESGGDSIEGRKTDEGEEYARQRQKLVSKVLEIGIIFHSVIIGITLGMSQNRCTIGPLVGALSFHQFFEGMGLGGCVALEASWTLKEESLPPGWIYLEASWTFKEESLPPGWICLHYNGVVEMIRCDLLMGHWIPYLECTLKLNLCYDEPINGGEVAATILQNTATGNIYYAHKWSKKVARCNHRLISVTEDSWKRCLHPGIVYSCSKRAWASPHDACWREKMG